MFHLHQMRVQCALLLHANVPRPVPHLDMHVCVCARGRGHVVRPLTMYELPMILLVARATF